MGDYQAKAYDEKQEGWPPMRPRPEIVNFILQAYSEKRQGSFWPDSDQK